MANTAALRSAMANALNNISQTLLQNQKAIDIVSNNIANVNTEGYSRVVPKFSSLATGGSLLTSAKRVFNKYLFERMISANQEHSYLQSYNDTISQLESLFKDSMGGGMSQEIDNFYNSLNDIISHPENLPSRKSFLNSAKLLAAKLQDTNNSIEDTSHYIHKSIRNSISKVNALTSQLKKINEQIKYFSSDETKLNAYLDQRDTLLKELSRYIDVKVRINRNKTVDVFTAKGHMLVLRDKVDTLSVKSTKKVMTNSFIIPTASKITDPTKPVSNSGSLIIKYIYDGKEKNYTIDYTNRSLQQIANEINGSENFRATIINTNNKDNEDFKLVISTKFDNKENYITKIEDSDGDDTKGFDTTAAREVYKKKYRQSVIQSGAVELTGLIQKGQLGAFIEAEKFTNQLQANLNQFAQDFAYHINSIHRLGKDLNGEDGVDLFVNEKTKKNLDIDASTITVGTEDPQKLALSLSGRIGDNTIAKALQKTGENQQVYYDNATNILKTYEKEKSLDNLTYNDFYSEKLVASVAFEKSYTQSRLEDSSLMLDVINDKIQEVSGVNLDEELVQLTKLQRSYQATARVMMVTDELFKTLIEMTK